MLVFQEETYSVVLATPPKKNQKNHAKVLLQFLANAVDFWGLRANFTRLPSEGLVFWNSSTSISITTTTSTGTSRREKGEGREVCVTLRVAFAELYVC